MTLASERSCAQLTTASRKSVTIVRRNPERYPEFKFYPGMPYAHKYADAVTEEGVIGALKKFTSGNVLGVLAKGGKAVVTKTSFR